MRPSTEKALFVAVGLAIAAAEFGAPDHPEAGGEADAARRPAFWRHASAVTPAEAATTPESEVLGIRAEEAAAAVGDAAEATPSRFVALRREYVIRRARHGLATAAVDL